MLDRPSGKFVLKTADAVEKDNAIRPNNPKVQGANQPKGGLIIQEPHTSDEPGILVAVPVHGRSAVSNQGLGTFADTVARSELGRHEHSMKTAFAALQTQTSELSKQQLVNDSPAEVVGDAGLDSNPDTKAAMSPLRWLSDPEHNVETHVDQAVNKLLQEYRDDNEYWHQTWLQKARHKINSSHAMTASDQPTSVFKKLKPKTAVAGKYAKLTPDSASFQVDIMDSGKSVKTSSWTLACDPITAFPTDEPPNYSHYVSIKNNFLAHNETVLQHWPYFGDDFDNSTEGRGLASTYFLDITERQRKLECMLRAERLMDYADDMLRAVGCSWPDVLRFLLDPSPEVGSDLAALKARSERDKKFCDEDFARGSQRWTDVLSKLPLSSPDAVGRAAILCDKFQEHTKLRLWHIARRCDFVLNLLSIRNIPPPETMTCRICMRHNCPYHGEIHEQSNIDDSNLAESTDDDAVETDIIIPREVNFRHHVKFPNAIDGHGTSEEFPIRHSLKWWQDSGILWRAEDRPPYYPCSHPGETCVTAKCVCFRNNVPCEKMCGCGPTCKRKWQGCSCSSERTRKGQKLVCFEDERCACYGLNRECDPDLCGACGVCDVLDPVHRHNDAILAGRCNNANIQRGVAKHTLLGTSGVHGFGLYAGQRILEHDFVGEYKGEIITKSESDRRAAVYEHQKLSYLFSLNKTQEIDSTYFGNKVRFINHADSRKANLYPRIMIVNLVHRIGLFGSRTVDVGEELFFDYGPEFPDDQLGGVKATKKGPAAKGAKSAPRVRNSLLTRDFFDVDYKKDALGNYRAVKAGHDGNWEMKGRQSARGRSQGARSSGAGKTRGRRAKPRIVVEDEDEDEDEDDDEDDGDDEDDEDDEIVVEVDRRTGPEVDEADVGGDPQSNFEGWYINDGHQTMDVDNDSADDEDFQPEDGSESTSDNNQDSQEEQSD